MTDQVKTEALSMHWQISTWMKFFPRALLFWQTSNRGFSLREKYCILESNQKRYHCIHWRRDATLSGKLQMHLRGVVQKIQETNLKFRGKSLSLHMVKDIWVSAESKTSLSSLRTHWLTPDHFPPKNPPVKCVFFSCSRFFWNNDQVNLTIWEWMWRSWWIWFNYVANQKNDRMVDICNNTGMSNKGVEKGC